MSAFEFLLSDVTFTNGSDIAQVNNTESINGVIEGSSIFVAGYEPLGVLSSNNTTREITLARDWPNPSVTSSATILPTSAAGVLLDSIQKNRAAYQAFSESLTDWQTKQIYFFQSLSELSSFVPAAGTSEEDAMSRVWNDPIDINNGYYGWTGSTWEKDRYEADIFNTVSAVNQTHSDLLDELLSLSTPAEENDLIHGVVDKNGFVALGINSKGEQVGHLRNLVDDTTELQQQVNYDVATELVEASKNVSAAGAPLEEEDLLHGITDENFNIAFGINSKGEQVGHLRNLVDDTTELQQQVNYEVATELVEAAKNVSSTGAPLEEEDLLHGVSDENFNIAFGINSKGEQVGHLRNLVEANTVEQAEKNQKIDQELYNITELLASETLDSAPAEENDLIHGVVDKNGVVAFGINSKGEQVGHLRNLVDDTTELQQQVNYDVATELVEAAKNVSSAGAPLEEEDLLHGITDENFNIAFGINSKGEQVGHLRNLVDANAVEQAEKNNEFDERIKNIPLSSTLTIEDFQPIVFTKNVVGVSQVYLVNSTGEVEVTPSDYDALYPTVHKNSYIKFASDMDGQFKMWRKSLYATNLVKSHNNTIEHFLIVGQSNTIPKGVAGYGGPITSGKVLPGAALQFNGGARHIWPNFFGGWTTNDHDAAIIDSELDRFIDLDAVASESHAYAFTEIVNSDNAVHLWSGHGKGGAPYSVIKKGSQAYLNSLACVSRAKEIANSLGMEYKVSAILCEHGEADAQNSAYLTALNEFEQNYNDDIRAITEQDSDIVMYISQQQSWALEGDHATSKSVIAQLEFHEQNNRGRLVGPKYFLPHDSSGVGDGTANDGDGVHLSAYGVRTMGEYYAKAYTQGDNWAPLMPNSVLFNGTDKITVSFVGRVGDLQLNVYDEQTNPLGVSDPGNYGFELIDAPNATISTVGLSSDKTQIEIFITGTLSVNSYLAYAYTAPTLPANAGPLTGPRGCVCDSDATAPTPTLIEHRQVFRGFSASISATPLYNWLITFIKPIQS